MKKIKITIICLFISCFSFGQMVTTDPILTGIFEGYAAQQAMYNATLIGNSTTQATSAATSAAETVQQTSLLVQTVDFFKEQKENLSKLTILKDLESYKRLYTLIKAFACVAKDLEFAMAVADNSNDCLINFEYQMIMAELAISQDVAMAITSITVLMTEADRIKSIEGVVLALEKAYTMATRLNQNIRLSVRRDVTKQLGRDAYLNSSSFGEDLNTSFY